MNKKEYINALRAYSTILDVIEDKKDQIEELNGEIPLNSKSFILYQSTRNAEHSDLYVDRLNKIDKIKKKLNQYEGFKGLIDSSLTRTKNKNIIYFAILDMNYIKGVPESEICKRLDIKNQMFNELKEKAIDTAYNYIKS